MYCTDTAATSSGTLTTFDHTPAARARLQDALALCTHSHTQKEPGICEAAAAAARLREGDCVCVCEGGSERARQRPLD